MQEPIGQVFQFNCAPDWRKKQMWLALVEFVLVDNFKREVEIGAIFDDELYFVCRVQSFKIWPEIAFSFAAARTLYVQNFDRSRVKHTGVQSSAGFNQHGEAFVAQSLGQFAAFALLPNSAPSPCFIAST